MHGLQLSLIEKVNKQGNREGECAGKESYVEEGQGTVLEFEVWGLETFYPFLVEAVVVRIRRER